MGYYEALRSLVSRKNLKNRPKTPQKLPKTPKTDANAVQNGQISFKSFLDNFKDSL